jgi:hypothetical protein
LHSGKQSFSPDPPRSKLKLLIVRLNNCGMMGTESEWEFFLSAGASRYMRTWLILDVASTVPFAGLAWILTGHQGRGLTYGLLNMLRLWRLRRASALFARIEKDVRFNYFWIRCLKLFLPAFIICWLSDTQSRERAKHGWGQYFLTLDKKAFGYSTSPASTGPSPPSLLLGMEICIPSMNGK